MSYLIAPLQKVRSGEFPEFQQAMASLEAAARQRAAAIFSGFTPGGVLPGDGSFGQANLLPKKVLGAGTFTWVQTFRAPGSFTNIFSYTVPNDEIHAYAGFIIPDPLIFSQFRMQVSDRIYPILEVEEARAFKDGFAIVLKQDSGAETVVEEKKIFTLQGYQERGTSGNSQRVIPIGFALYINKDTYISTGRT